MDIEIWKSLPKLDDVGHGVIDMTGIDFVMSQSAYESLLLAIEPITDVRSEEVLQHMDQVQPIGNVLIFPTQPDSLTLENAYNQETDALQESTLQGKNIGYASIMGWGMVVGAIASDPVLRSVGITAAVFGEIKLMQNGVIPDYGAMVDGLRSNARWLIDKLDGE